MQIDSSTASLDLLTCDLTNKDEAISINKVSIVLIAIVVVVKVVLKSSSLLLTKLLMLLTFNLIFLIFNMIQATVAVNKATGKPFSKDVS